MKISAPPKTDDLGVLPPMLFQEKHGSLERNTLTDEN